MDITISSTNDAPILDSSVALSLDSESEDVIAPAGKSVQLMLANAGDPITDVDDGAIEGIAVVAVDNTHGEWQYSTDGGSTWAPFDTSSKTMARLLAADERTRLRFKPTRDFHGTVTDGLLFRAWDQTSGSAGAIADLSATGDTTPFSTDSAGVSITVISVNDAPVLDGSVAFALPSMLEDATEPLGQSVVALLDSAGGDPITDVDDAAEGIAVVAANDDHGKWQYSTNGGSSWLRFGNPSITMARLLAADADTRLRFVPAADYSGTVTDGLLFHAWDQTSGSAGAVADLSAIGDTTPFSTASAEISITVDPVNSAPSFTGGEDRVVDEDAGPQILETWVKDISPGPANESDQSVYFTIVNDSTELFLDPPSITPEGTLTYTTAENAYGKATLAIRLHDDGGTDNGGIDSSAAHTFAITINSVNDAPKLDSNIAMVLPSAWEDSEDLPEDDVASILASTDGDPITDVDADAVEGIAVVAVDNTNGAWQFSTNGGNTWTSFDRPRETSARLLASDERTKLRFKPDPDYSGTVSNGIIFHAWDQTSGVSGATANLNAIGKATPFSVRLAGISVTVNPINDPPSFTGGKSQVVNEDAGPKKISEWAMDISPGPDSESDQIVYFTIVSDSTELFLEPPSITREGTLTYTTAENAYGSGTLTVRLHDDGDTENGGIDSSAAQTFTITIQPVNDAPHLSNLSPPKPYTEDGPPVVLAPDGTINDVELDSKKDGAGNYNGATLYLECQNDTIQHSLSSNSVSDLQPLDQGKNLMIGTKTIGMVENNSDGLLELIFNDSATTSLVSYVIRNITYSTTHQSPPENVVIDFRLNDGNKGDQGEGGEKTGSEVITLALINLPDPPVLDITFSPKLASVPEDSTNNKGNSVAEIIVNGSISDADGVVEAMAVVSVDNSDGQWQYSTDDGRFWHSFTEEKGRKVNLSDKARLLDSIHKIRFVPDAHFHGDAIFTFRAWDQSSGIAGLTADLSSGTGMTSFSSAKDDATIKVLSVNDPPEFTCCEEDLSVEPGQQLSLTLSAMDVDGDPLLYSVEGEPDGSFLRDSTFTWSPTLEQIGNFFPTFTVEDTAGGWDTQDVTISVFEPPTPDLGQITYNPRQPRTEVPLEIVISGEFPASNAKISKQSFSREDDSIFIEFKTAWKGNITQPADEIATPWSVEGNVGSFEVGFYNVEVKANGKEYLTDFFPVLCPTCNESWILMDLDPSQGDQGDRRGAGAIINGKEYEIQLIKTSGEKIRGWSAVLRYDPHQLNYVTGSFQPSSYIPGLEKLIKEEWGKVTLGGTPLGSSEFGSGPGDLGTLSFEVLEGFQDSTIIMMTQNILYDDDGFIPFDDIFTSVTITSEITKKCGCIPDDFICLCDFDGNGEVGFEDFFLFADRFGLKEGEECEESPCYDYCYDLDEDGEIGFGDFFIFADCFGNDERPKLLALASEHLGLPLSPLLEQNFPNPFNASTTIRYIIGEEGIVQLRIFDLTGQIIRDLVTETQAPGIYQVVWDGKDNEGRLVANGMYIGELRIRNFSETIKMVLLQ